VNVKVVNILIKRWQHLSVCSLVGLHMMEVSDNTLLQVRINKCIIISMLNFTSLLNGISLQIY